MGLVTQQDPIGIAGGLNLYGYANGDPVNYSDPFGLSAQACCRDLFAAAAGLLPGVGDLNDGVALVTGHDALTGEQLGGWGRTAAAAGLVFGSGQSIRGAGKILGGLFERFGKASTDVIENGVRRTEFDLDDGSKMISRGPETHPIQQGGPPVTHYNVEVHEPTRSPGRFTQTENTHLDPDGRVINP